MRRAVFAVFVLCALSASAPDARAEGTIHPCCSATGAKGCPADPWVQDCVCAADPSCCTDGWTQACVAMVTDVCGTSCLPQPDFFDCCEPHSTPGCGDPGAASCVCSQLDADCCTTAWTKDCARNAPSLCAAVCRPPGNGDCCGWTDGPGCKDPEIEACVCALDPACCGTKWDPVCAWEAQYECGACGGKPKGSCCDARADAGCEDPAVEACVCAKDSTCCDKRWSGKCAKLAVACDGPCAPVPSTSTCCTLHAGEPGCIDAAVQSCVCKTRKSCCDEGWDAACVVLADSCGGTCAPQGQGACCDAHASGGCASLPVEACVCQQDPSCCSGSWGAGCAALADGCGASCPGVGPPCCEASGLPGGCESVPITACVCGEDATCCDKAWDAVCVGIAAKCGAGCGAAPPGGGSCTQDNGSPGCDDDAVEACVCDLEGFCCDVTWDSGCAQLAVGLCIPEVCGDGVCAGDEHCGGCPADCGCAGDEQCASGVCLPKNIFGWTPPPALGWGTTPAITLGCQAPSAALCTSPTYLNTACGRKLLADAAASPAHPCHAAVTGSAQQVGGGLLGATKTVVQPQVRAFGGALFEPPTPLFAAVVHPEPAPADAATITRWTPWSRYGAAVEAFAKAGWASNGARLVQCEEYLYDKHYDYHRFEDAAAALGGDAVAVYALAFGPASAPESVGTRAVAGLPLRRKTGEPSRPLTLNAHKAKSVFFSLPPAVMSMLQQHPKANPTFQLSTWQPGQPLSELNPGPTVWSRVQAGKSTFIHSFAWHKQRAEALAAAGYSPADLAFYEPFKARFRRILADADYAVNHQTLVDLAAPGVQPSEAAAARAMDELVEALEDAADLGCLNGATLSPCDWSHRDLLDDLAAVPLPGREEDLDECRSWTGDLHWPQLQSWSFPALDGPGSPGVDYSASTVTLEQFFVDKDAWLRALVAELADLGLDEVDGRPSVGRTAADTRNIAGGDWFGVSYSFEHRWSVTGLATSPKAQPNADVRARARFSADASVFRKPLSLASATVEINGTTDGSDMSSISIHLLGIDVYSPAPWRTRLRQTWNVVQDSWERTETYSYKGPVIPIAGIPVRIEGGVSGTIGLESDVSVSAQAVPLDVRIDAAFTPSARLDGFLKAYVDFVILRAGIRGDLLLLGATLPMTAHLRLHPHTDPAIKFVAEAAVDVGATLETLSGRLALFAEIDAIIYEETFEKTLVSWDGWSTSGTVYDLNLSVPLGGLIDACKVPGLLACP